MQEYNKAIPEDVSKETLKKELIKAAISHLIKENYSWHNYNPRGEYVNICFTLKGVDMYKFVNDELKKAKVVRLEM